MSSLSESAGWLPRWVQMFNQGLAGEDRFQFIVIANSQYLGQTGSVSMGGLPVDK